PNRSQFRAESFPQSVGNFSRIHAEIVDGGRRMLVIYGSERYRPQAIAGRDSIARLVAAQLADRQRAVQVEAELAEERRKAAAAEADRQVERERAELGESALQMEQTRLTRLLEAERQSSAAARERT